MIFNSNKIRDIAGRLRSGQVVVFPCDTVWGILGIVRDDVVNRIYEIKKRKKSMPLLVLIADLNMLRGIAKPLKSYQKQNIEKYWPGPVTMIFKKSAEFPDIVTGGLSTVGVRFPDFKPLSSIIAETGEPVISTSANISMTAIPGNRKEISEQIIEKSDYIYDDFEPELGQESIVIDCVYEELKVLRGKL